jgi:hypothetical protein
VFVYWDAGELLPLQFSCLLLQPLDLLVGLGEFKGVVALKSSDLLAKSLDFLLERSITRFLLLLVLASTFGGI